MEHRSIDIPRDWIESRLAARSPELGIASLDQIRQEAEDLAAPDTGLGCSVSLSYMQGFLESSAERLAHSSDDLAASLRSDFEAGVVVEATQWSTPEGHRKICILGRRWRAIIKPQLGKSSSNTLAVIENVKRLDNPPRWPMCQPDSVVLEPIWEEAECDPEFLLSQYASCMDSRRLYQKRQADLERTLDEARERRGKAFQSICGELTRGQCDDAAHDRAGLHAHIRKQYSALRAMMELLRLRTERQQSEFAATLALSPLSEENAAPAVPSLDPANAPDDQHACLVADRAAIDGLVEESASLEVTADGGRWYRCRVLDVTRSGKDMRLEVDLDAPLRVVGTSLRVRVLSRFGLGAHQRAVQNLLDENVQGYWPHLAQMLCRPERLAIAADSTPPGAFFCDSDPSLPPLNQQQRAAVVGALNTPHVFCIQGPPGTGKTTVICELVQQLAARGERVLLAAPTHVAVDEVLRRIGSRAGVHPLRLSWDEGRVAEDVRRFTPSQFIDPFAEHGLSGGRDDRNKWKQEIEELKDTLASLDSLAAALSAMTRATTARAEMEASKAAALTRRDAEVPGLASELTVLDAKIADANRQLSAQRTVVAAAEAALREVEATAGLGGRLLGFLGLGEISRRRGALQSAVAAYEGHDVVLSTTSTQRDEKTSAMQRLQDAAAASTEAAALARAAEAGARQRLDAAMVACRAKRSLINVEPNAQLLASLHAQLTERLDRLKGYVALRTLFGELVTAEVSGTQDTGALRHDLLSLCNLVCCTTTGIAGSRELANLAFDTLIIDEASRVTDSEFLISAVKARRWILVGDEHQLPPFVEQSDEHFIHALSALARAERDNVSIDNAVDALGNMWEEDEELHKFRRDNVSSIAMRLHDAGDWNDCYRTAFRAAEKFVSGEHEDPTRALLRAMRDSLVRSLFERLVSVVPAELRVRLVEQRRMIGPIADIVSQPIYGGDYVTPPAEQLAERGITPLVTPTFPKPITFLDTSAMGIRARDDLLRNSFVNRAEARLVVQACEVLDRELSQQGSGAVTVSILAFYKAQAKLIDDQLTGQGARRRRFRCLRFSVIDAIDRIQGQESDVVILSFCRTAGKTVTPRFGQWLQDLRRVNVACTRAHRALIFVGQKELLARLCATPEAQTFYAHLDNLFETRTDVMERKVQFGGGGR